jgi:hypothetical protein
MASRLIAYCDESYSDRATFVVAGYVGPSTAWRKVGYGWKRILGRYRVSEFHAVDCTQGRGLFKGWLPEQREALQRELATLLAASSVDPVVTAIQLPGWPGIADRIRRARPRQWRPYHLAFEHQLTLMAQQQLGGKQVINFVFDKIAKHQGGAAEVFGSLQRRRPPALDFAVRLGTLAFVDSATEFGLQAADFLAYESKRHLEVEWGHAQLKNRTQWFGTLISRIVPRLPDAIRFFDSRALERYADAAEASALNRALVTTANP